MNKTPLKVSILVAGILLGIFHYKLKPAPSDKELREYAEGMRSATEWKNQIAPDFELKTTRGERFQLSENIGKKIIVLNFFATWCGPCRAEMPELNRYFNEHKGESFLLVGIDSEEKQDRVDSFIEQLKIDFPVGIDDGPIQKQYGVSAYPTTVLIGVDGKVQFYETGALVNAEVAFDKLRSQNRQLMEAGKIITPADYRLQAQKQPTLPVLKAQEMAPAEKESPLDPRAKRIVARMDCPCGCEKKVQTCVCNLSTKIKSALAKEDFKDKPDEEIIKALNKQFCSGDM
ncbi:MAG: TlpA disulfide reductase family protein [Candidatus Acidiferrales bacterium]